MKGKLKVAGVSVCFKECYVVWETGMNYYPIVICTTKPLTYIKAAPVHQIFVELH